ncbi:MAG: hypothetical protein JWQ30_1593 [Sediminibacterium sp.]|nr:hypothetical protein [Sediminibacterium sp.]
MIACHTEYTLLYKGLVIKIDGILQSINPLNLVKTLAVIGF